MLSKVQVKEKHKEVLRRLIPLEEKMLVPTNTYNSCSNKILRDGMTCDTCPDNDKCEFAFDPYNTDDDCIAVK